MDESAALIDKIIEAVPNEELYAVAFEALSSMISHPDTLMTLFKQFFLSPEH